VYHRRNKGRNQKVPGIYQTLWDTAKAVLRDKFMAMNAYIKNTQRSQINDQILHLKLPEKEAKQKISWRNIIKIRAKINKIETKKTI
jgi:hypothetical protein